MLSPGQWYKSVPKDKLANVKFRVGILEAARDDRNLQRGLLEICKRDILFYINVFCWQYNPKNAGSEVEPFISWPFQDDALRRTIDRLFGDQRRVLWEKSRELGATWLALILFDWCSLFHPRKKFLAISHSEAAVDRPGDPDTLFWKIQFMHEHLPDWMVRGVKKRKLGFNYVATKSSLNGSATTERSGVGGRASALLLDEFSKHRQDRDILGQTADTGPCLFIGTHYGLGTAFYDLTQRPDMFKVVMHWSQHPEKNKGLYRSGTKGGFEILDTQYAFPPDFKFVTDGSPIGGPYPGIRSPWYDAECTERGNARDVAMHLDINPSGSMSQSFSPLLIRTLIDAYARSPMWEGDVLYDPDLGVPDKLCERSGGLLRLWLNPTKDGKIPPGSYAAGCDVSQGTGATPSCICIGNVQTGEKVGELSTPFMDPKAFAVLAVAVCNLFADSDGQGALLVWEVPGPGLTFGPRVLELNYTNVYRRIRTDLLTKKVTENVGWANNVTAANQLLLEYRIALERRQFLNRSEAALKETLAFQFDAQGNESHAGSRSINDPSGARANHGDLVMSDAMLWLLMKGKAVTGRKEVQEETPINSLAGRRQMRQDTLHSHDGWTSGGRLCNPHSLRR